MTAPTPPPVDDRPDEDREPPVIERDPDELPTGFRGLLMPTNTRSGDYRQMVLDEGTTEVPSRPLPVAFSAQTLSDEGHKQSIVVGIITRLWLEADGVHGEGPFDLNNPEAAEWARKLSGGFAGWVSADLTDATVVEVPLDPSGEEIDVAALNEQWAAWEEQLIAWENDGGEGDPPPAPAEPEISEILLKISDWKMAGATMVSTPAFEDARVEPVFGEEFVSTDAVSALVAAATEHTGAMIALVPSEADIARLAVEGYEPPAELHTTLAFLGEADAWTPDQRTLIETAIRELSLGPINAEVWGHAAFNPQGDEPCAVYLVGAEGSVLPDLQASVMQILAEGDYTIPDQHTPWIPHITAGYGLGVGELTEAGPIVFDRLRLAFAGEAIDISLGGMTAAALTAGATLFDSADFKVPEPAELTALTVTDDGRVFGHLAEYGSCHIGFSDVCISPPTSLADYRYFHQGEVITEAGALPVGKITLGTGHAGLNESPRAAAAHYDNSGSVVAVVRCSEGELGPWLSGRLVPGVDDRRVDELRRCGVSGDWRGIDGNLELVAALAVNVPGFPVPRARGLAASGQLALVASGIVPQSATRQIKLTENDAAGGDSDDAVRKIVRATIREFAAERERAEAMTASSGRIRQNRAKLAARKITGKWGTM